LPAKRAQSTGVLLYARAVWRRLAACVVAFALPLWAAQVRAENGPVPAPHLPPQVTETSGLALGVQLPTGAGLVGVRADYLFQVPRSFLRFGVSAGVGALLCIDGCHASALFGGIVSWGHRHRIYFEVASGTFEGISVTVHGEHAGSRALWGIASQVGYEYMSESGFFTSFGAGIALLFEPAIYSVSERLGPAITLLHVGYKLW
jgi:hypothetical protein